MCFRDILGSRLEENLIMGYILILPTPNVYVEISDPTGSSWRHLRLEGVIRVGPKPTGLVSLQEEKRQRVSAPCWRTHSKVCVRTPKASSTSQPSVSPETKPTSPLVMDFHLQSSEKINACC